MIILYIILIVLGFFISIWGIDCMKTEIYIVFSMIGFFAGLFVHQIIICTFIGMVIGLIFAKISDKKFWENYEKERKAKAAKIAEGKRINQQLSECIRYYLKTGIVPDGYYAYNNYPCCSIRINKEIEKLLSIFKNWLIKYVDDPTHYIIELRRKPLMIIMIRSDEK